MVKIIGFDVGRNFSLFTFIFIDDEIIRIFMIAFSNNNFWFVTVHTRTNADIIADYRFFSLFTWTIWLRFVSKLTEFGGSIAPFAFSLFFEQLGFTAFFVVIPRGIVDSLEFFIRQINGGSLFEVISHACKAVNTFSINFV